MLIDKGVYSDDHRKLGSYWTDVHQIFTQCSHIIAAIPIHFGMRQRRMKLNMPILPLRFVVIATSLERSQNEWTLDEALPSHMPTHPENLVKTGTADSEIMGWEVRY